MVRCAEHELWKGVRDIRLVLGDRTWIAGLDVNWVDMQGTCFDKGYDKAWACDTYDIRMEVFCAHRYILGLFCLRLQLLPTFLTLESTGGH